jgi:hypothetical protein
MGGTWTSQNKILPGAYINFLTNTALSITPGDRGTVVLLQEMSVGAAGDMYKITATDEAAYPEAVKAAEKMLVNQALKGAKTVIVYNLGASHTAAVVTAALAALKTIEFNTLCYPYDAAAYATNQASIKTWITAMRDTEGRKIQAVMADCIGDNEGVINVTQGVKLTDGTILTNAQTTAWVAGVTAGAAIYQSNTGKRYADAIDVVPRMAKTEMEAAITAGKFIFKVDSAQNVTAVYDINSLTSFTVEKSDVFKKNRVIRTIDGINNDIVEIFESNYVGKTNNNADGRALLRATLVQYFNELQNLSAIQGFTEDDVKATAGTNSDAVLIECYVQPVDSVEKIYINVNLS